MAMPHRHFVNDEEDGLLQKFPNATRISEVAEGVCSDVDGNLEDKDWME